MYLVYHSPFALTALAPLQSTPLSARISIIKPPLPLPRRLCRYIAAEEELVVLEARLPHQARVPATEHVSIARHRVDTERVTEDDVHQQRVGMVQAVILGENVVALPDTVVDIVVQRVAEAVVQGAEIRLGQEPRGSAAVGGRVSPGAVLRGFHDPLDHATLPARETHRRASHVVEERGSREAVRVCRLPGLIPLSAAQSQEKDIPLEAHMDTALRWRSQFSARNDTVRGGGVIDKPLWTTRENIVNAKREAEWIEFPRNLATFSSRPKNPRGTEQASGGEDALVLVLQNQNAVLVIEKHGFCPDEKAELRGQIREAARNRHVLPSSSREAVWQSQGAVRLAVAG